MSENETTEIFTRSLPSVAAGKRSAFLDGMRRYHAKFKKYREDLMNYEADEQYLNEWVEIAVMDRDDYWIYSPQFSKVTGLVLNELFKTKIQCHNLPDPLNFDRDLIFIDKHANRWTVSIRTRDNEPEQLRVCMRLPRSVPRLCMCGVSLASENECSVVGTKMAIQVIDTSVWYD